MFGRGCVVGLIAVGLGGSLVLGQSGTHLNPMVDLLKEKKPVFGVAIPSAGRGGGGNRGRAGAAADPTTPAPPPAPVKTPLELAKDTLAHPEADYFFNGGLESATRFDATLASFVTYADALVDAGAVRKSPRPRLLAPINAKAPNISDDPVKAIDHISRELNAGISSISFVEVDTAQELQQGIAAMRFKSRGGTRPDDIGNAAKYWGLSERDYRAKADVWPLNPNGELVAWAIIETIEGLANVREIAQVKGLGALIVGAGTLGGVTSRTNPDGTRTRDPEAWEAAIQKILSACKEFKMPCGYPANEKDIEMRMKQGFSVFIIQSFSDSGFRAVDIGRKAAGR
jgi:2-keto-3-deoxy-L-rhamnonate aldolase RhmA